MKDSHDQTAPIFQRWSPAKHREMLEKAAKAIESSDGSRNEANMIAAVLHEPADMPIVQDYREYTAEEILHGIVKFTEQAGWGDPANLGHWLGAAQRWAQTR